MASPKPPSGSTKRPTESDLLKELKSFRKEALHVTENDVARWKEEAGRLRPSDQPEEPKLGPVPAPPPRPRHWKHRRKVAIGVIAVCAIGLVAEVVKVARDMGPAASPAASASAGSAAPPTPSPARSVRTVTPTLEPLRPAPVVPGPVTLAQAYLVCRLEVDRAIVALPASVRATRPTTSWLSLDASWFDGTGMEGPEAIFDPAFGMDPLARYQGLLPGGAQAAASGLLDDLARLSKTATLPDERLVADALTEDLREVAQRGRRLLAEKRPGLLTSVVALVTGVAEALDAPDSAPLGPVRALLAHALGEADEQSPWPSRALALVDFARGRPDETVPLLEKRWARFPKDELTGFQLVQSLIMAGQGPRALEVATKLAGASQGDAARLLATWIALSAGNARAARALLAPIEGKLDGRFKAIASRAMVLKGWTSLLENPADPRPALQAFETALQRDRTCPWANLALGKTLARLKRGEEAVTYYAAYLKNGPRPVPLRHEYAQLLVSTASQALALGEYRWLLQNEGRRREIVDAFAQAATAINRVDLLQYEVATVGKR